LPVATTQHERVAAAVARLTAVAPPRPEPKPSWVARLGPLGLAAFGVWKLISIGKVASLLSLAASFAVYWTAWGWRFAAGFLGSIYLHELGHVVALRRAGIPASPPMFIPGFGAYVRLRAAPRDPETNALVGLAGPLAGLGVAVALYWASQATGSPLLRALAHAGAVLNLFNLVPAFSLDGDRGMGALAAPLRWALVLVIGGALAFTDESMLWPVLIVAALRAFSPRAPERGDLPILGLFAGLVVALSLVAQAARPP
jgi:Zn-dependent protease